jgi:hypothetical protein
MGARRLTEVSFLRPPRWCFDAVGAKENARKGLRRMDFLAGHRFVVVTQVTVPIGIIHLVAIVLAT